MEGFVRGFYSISEWIMKLAYVNILWISFSILGIVIFGFFPATIAMFAVVRKWVLKEPDIPVFKTFWATYKTEFLKSNLLGMVIVAFSLFLYFNLNIVQATTLPVFKLLYIPNVIVLMIFLLTLLYVMPVFVHFDVSLGKVMKNALFLMVVNPKATFCMMTLIGFLCFILLKLPGLIPFFSGSVIAYLLMWFSRYGFMKVDTGNSQLS